MLQTQDFVLLKLSLRKNEPRYYAQKQTDFLDLKKWFLTFDSSPNPYVIMQAIIEPWKFIESLSSLCVYESEEVCAELLKQLFWTQVKNHWPKAFNHKCDALCKS